MLIPISFFSSHPHREPMASSSSKRSATQAPAPWTRTVCAFEARRRERASHQLIRVRRTPRRRTARLISARISRRTSWHCSSSSRRPTTTSTACSAKTRRNSLATIWTTASTDRPPRPRSSRRTCWTRAEATKKSLTNLHSNAVWRRTARSTTPCWATASERWRTVRPPPPRRTTNRI